MPPFEPEPGKSAAIVSFEANPTTLEGPGSTHLSWVTSDTVSLTLTQGGSPVSIGDSPIAEGGLSVSISETSIFELTAIGAAGEPATSRITVEVVDVLLPPTIASFSGPTEVEADEFGTATVTLEWTGVVGAETLVLEADDDEPRTIDLDLTPSGSVEVEIAADTAFQLIATNEAGEVAKITEIRLVLLPKIDSFSPDRFLVGIAETVELSWSTTDAAGIELLREEIQITEVDAEPLEGVHAEAILFDTTFTLRAVNELGTTVEESFTVRVGPPILISLTGNAHALWLGETLNLEWTSEGVSWLTVSAIGYDAICESFERKEVANGWSCDWEPPLGGHFVTVWLSNSSGTEAAPWDLLVANGPRIASFTVEPAEINVGESFTVSWEVLPDPAGAEATLGLVDNVGNTYPVDEQVGSIQIPWDGTPGHVEFELEASTDHPLSSPVSVTARVQVHGLPKLSFDASPTHYDHTVDDIVLSWTTEFAASLKIFELIGPDWVEIADIPEGDYAAGSLKVDPLVDTSYRAVVTNPLGLVETVERSVTVALPEILSLTADVTDIKMGEPVKLTWTTRMADQVSFDFGNTHYVVGESQEPYINAKALGGTKLPVHPTECGSSPWTSACVAFTFPDGFSFPFDGTRHTVARVINNGFISFQPEHMTQVTAGNTSFPVTGTTYRYVHLAPFWDYLSWMDDWQVWIPGKEFGDLHYLLQEDPVRGRYLIIQWNEVRFSSSYKGSLNFEIVLWEQGGFEYRFGVMDAGPNPTATELEYLRGLSATIGYQTPSQSSAHTIQNNKTTIVHGELHDRTFTYLPTPVFPKNGSYDWRPLAKGEIVEAIMTVRRGPHTVTEKVSVRIQARPEVLLGSWPTEPQKTGEGFRLTWTTKFASGLQVLDQGGNVLCTAADQFAIDNGYCVVDLPEGHYTLIVRATGADGTVSERSMEATFYTPFSIEKFEADKTGVEQGEPLTLTWETTNASSISLTANGAELLPTGAPSGPGSLTLPSIAADTTFVLRLTNGVGMEEVREISVVLWTARLELSADQTSVRPGTPIAINVSATDMAGGPAPVVYGSFAMKEVTSSSFMDISGASFATLVNLSNESGSGYAAIEFPPGFEFPFYGKKYSDFRVMADGYITFEMGTATSNSSNRVLPDLSTVASYQGIHLAPFWDDLHRRTGGSTWVGQPTPDTFVVQWKNWSKVTGSTADIQYDLNFQVVFFQDGSFEYRYGTMAPPPPPNVHTSCYPNTCENDANGSSATIGYQAPDMDAGMTHHIGGMAQAAANVPYPGGLSNKVIRYEPLAGGGNFSVIPTRSETLTYCLEMGGTAACKSIDIAAEIGIDSFTIDQSTLNFGESTAIRWTTHGGTRLRIIDATETVLLDTSTLSEVDSGSLVVSPTENANYRLELTAPSNLLTANVQAEVIRVRMTLTAPATALPGVSIPLQWNLIVADPNLHPVIVAPMEERIDLPFSAMDIAGDEGPVVELWGPSVTTGVKELVFDDGFTFDYLGTPMSRAKVALEGYITFDMAATSSSATNQIIPNTSATYRRIHLAPFWDDFSSFTFGKVIAKRWDADTYVIQWSRMSLATGATAGTNMYDLNFMVVLHRNGDFEFRYGTMLPPSAPTTSTTACYPQTCEKEANGGAATIGYQDPTGAVGFMLHWAGNTTPNVNNSAVPQGLSNRSWKFTKTTAKTGSVQVAPWSSTAYNVCAIDPVSGDTFCPEVPTLIDVPWGIETFDATPDDPRRSDPVTLSWNTIGLDGLRLLKNGLEVFNHAGSAVPATGTLVENPSERTLYVLEGTSLGRTVAVERLVGIRTFEMNVVEPTGKHFPGDSVQVNWNITQLEPGTIVTTAAMVEVPAGPGQPGAYVDVSGLPGATQVVRTGAVGNGYYILELPFVFPYFGAGYHEAKAMVDGYVSFEMGTATGVTANGMMPDPSTTNRRVHLAPFWDDMAVRASDQLWIYSPDSTTFIIQWKNVNRSTGSSSSVQYDLNFQVVLRVDGTFEYRYGTMKPPPGLNNVSCYPSTCELEANGSSATIGFQSVDGMIAQVLHYGGNAAGETVPFVGGLENRTFRVSSALTGVENIKVSSSTDLPICAWVGDFVDCKTVKIRAVADPGDLMVTEVMLNPTGGQAEQWFEMRNLSNEPIDLNRFEVRNTRGTYPITSSIVVPPMGYAVFAASTLPGFTPQVIYGSALPFDAGQDKLELWAGPSAIISMTWDGTWSFPAGKTLYLDPVTQIHGRPSPPFANWCDGSQLGSPGAGDPACQPNAFYDVDPNGVGSWIDISVLGTRSQAFEATGRVDRLHIPGFSWTFFGSEVTTIWAGGKGWLSFHDVDPTGGTVNAPTAGAFPRTNTSTPRGPLVAGFWDNLICNRSLHDCFFTYFYGDVEGKKVLVAEWDNFRIGTSAIGGVSFQIQLWEDGDIKVVFGNVYSIDAPGTTNANMYGGSTAWIGLENMPRDEPDGYVTGLHRLPGNLSNRVFHFKAK